MCVIKKTKLLMSFPVISLGGSPALQGEVDGCTHVQRNPMMHALGGEFHTGQTD